jgi:hypothetical protein
MIPSRGAQSAKADAPKVSVKAIAPVIFLKYLMVFSFLVVCEWPRKCSDFVLSPSALRWGHLGGEMLSFLSRR